MSSPTMTVMDFVMTIALEKEPLTALDLKFEVETAVLVALPLASPEEIEASIAFSMLLELHIPGYLETLGDSIGVANIRLMSHNMYLNARINAQNEAQKHEGVIRNLMFMVKIRKEKWDERQQALYQHATIDHCAVANQNEADA